MLVNLICITYDTLQGLEGHLIEHWTEKKIEVQKEKMICLTDNENQVKSHLLKKSD